MNKDKLAEIAVKMIAACETYKKPRLNQIQENLDMYLNVERPALKGYSNVPIDYVVMSGFVDTLMSKIDDAPTVSFKHKTEADLKRAKKYTAFWEHDSSSVKEKWNAKDRNEKKQAIFEGVGISKLYAENTPEYKSNYENISLIDFIFEPAGGSYIQEHRYVGQTNILKTKTDLEDGIKDNNYDATQIKKLISATDDESFGKNEKIADNSYGRQRAMGLDVAGNNYIGEKLYNLTELYFIHNGVKYQALVDYSTGIWVKMIKMKDVFKSELYPYTVWQTENNFQSLLCPAPADIIRPVAFSMREVFNESMDNLKKNNNAMRIVDAKMIKNLNQLKWRKNGIVVADTSNGRTLDHAFKQIEVPDKTNLILNLTEWLDGFIGQKSGITASAQGATEKDAKVGIYYGDLQQVADRLGLLNKSYSEAWEDKALLWMYGVDEHLTEKYAVEIIGAKGMEWDEITSEDKKRDKELDVEISGGNAEEQLNEVKQKKKEEALATILNSPYAANLNPQWAIEQILRNGGFDESEIRTARDIKNYGEQESLSEAADENERMVKGEQVPPNRGATMAHIQKHLDFAYDTELDQNVYQAILAHVDEEMSYAQKNQERELGPMIANTPMPGGTQPPAGTPNLPGGNIPATAQRSQQTSNQLTP